MANSVLSFSSLGTRRRSSAILNLNKVTFLFVFLFVAIQFHSLFVFAKKDGKGTSYLKHTPEWERRKAKNSECRLGGLRFALNDTWSPNMGPPFGTWNCVRCTCTPVRKKRRIVAKVVCRNVKKECPDLNCQEAVLLPGACCKVCQEELPPSTGLKEYQKEEGEENASATRDFAVLLNGRTSRSPLTSTNLATGRLYLRRGNLHFSFVLDSKMSMSAPTTILFINDEGEIVEELEAQQTPYEINNGRLCGTWTRVPKQYRRLLMDERLWVSLPQPNEDEGVMGRISRYKGVDTEVFSSLLMPMSYNQTLPGGGTAIISVSSLSDSLHVSLIFNGVFEKSDSKNVTLMIELIPSRNLEPVVDQIVLEKVFSDINEASYMTTLGDTSLRLLTRGKVFIRVWSPSSPHLAIEGPVTARASCNVFSSIITTDVEATDEGKDAAIYRANYGAGWAVLTLSNDGAFEYQVRLEGLPAPIRRVTLVSTHRRKEREIHDLTESYVNGWINGTYGRPTFRDLDALLRRYIEVLIVMTDGGKLSGPLEPVSVTEALRSYHPTLLMGHNAWMAATAWVAVDSACVMHYDLKLAGSAPGVRGPLTWGPNIQEDPTWSLQLRENDTFWDPRLDLVNMTLEHLVTGRGIAAHTTQLTKISLTRLREGASFLDLTLMASSKDLSTKAVLSANIRGVEVPSSCLLDGVAMKNPIVSSDKAAADGLCRGFICLNEEPPKPISKSCIDDAKKVYDDGNTWSSPVDKCQRCMCTLGVIRCHIEPCPKLNCNDAITIPGQCCASCPIVSGYLSERVCEMADEVHTIGSSWHPFLAPNGFDTCVTCKCSITRTGDPRIDCPTVPCPILQCVDDIQIVVPGSCCRVCNQMAQPTNPKMPIDIGSTWLDGIPGQKDMSLNDTERVNYYVSKQGGCLERKVSLQQETLRYNGERWFPRLAHHWIRKCIACTCKNGSISCMPDDCPKELKCRGSKCKSKKKNRKKDSKKSRRRKKNKNKNKNKRKERRKEKKDRSG